MQYRRNHLKFKKMKHKHSTLLERLKPQGKALLSKLGEDDIKYVSHMLTKWKYVTDIPIGDYTYLCYQFDLTPLQLYDFYDLFYSL